MELDLFLPLEIVDTDPTPVNPSPINNSLTTKSTLDGDTVADGESNAFDT